MEITAGKKDIKLLYTELIRHKDFYIKQNHCLESFWGDSFERDREKEKEAFFNALIQEAISGEQLKTKTYEKVVKIIENEWGPILRLNVPIMNLSDKDYEEKVNFTLYKIKYFVLKEKKTDEE